MPVEFIDESTPRMNWEKYLERIRYTFGENVELADAYCEGYEDGIRGHAQYGEKGEEGYAGQAKDLYDRGFCDAQEDKSASFAKWTP